MKYKITIIFIFGLIAVGIFADVIFASLWGEPGTISARIWVISHERPIFPFVTGVLMGHLFWQARRVYVDVKERTEP